MVTLVTADPGLFESEPGLCSGLWFRWWRSPLTFGTVWENICIKSTTQLFTPSSDHTSRDSCTVWLAIVSWIQTM